MPDPQSQPDPLAALLANLPPLDLRIRTTGAGDTRVDGCINNPTLFLVGLALGLLELSRYWMRTGLPEALLPWGQQMDAAQQARQGQQGADAGG